MASRKWSEIIKAQTTAKGRKKARLELLDRLRLYHLLVSLPQNVFIVDVRYD